MENFNDEIRIKQIQIQSEVDPVKKQKLNNQLQVLRLNKEIQEIRNKINQLSKM